MGRLKVLTILGTRPEIIRLSRVMPALDRHTDHRIVHTAQNYDFELNALFFDELRLRRPDIVLDTDTSSLANALGSILSLAGKLLEKERPDAVLILGDTNSSIAAIMAKRLRIPVYHMEAGNRCFDLNVPEEINRRIVDCVADFNLVYTEHARRNLLAEGQPARRVYLTGSPMKEILDYYMGDIRACTVLDRLELAPGRYILVSMHREENVDDPVALATLLQALDDLAGRHGFPVIVSTHPRTKKRMEARTDIGSHALVQFLRPFGFFDYVRLQLDAFCVVSDSGTITEESALLGFPAVAMRNATERPEGLDTGSVILGGTTADSVLRAVETMTTQRLKGARAPIPADYLVDNVSSRVVNLITGTASLSNRWHGIVTPD